MNTDQENKETADRRFQRYQDKLDEELAFFRCKILTLAMAAHPNPITHSCGSSASAETGPRSSEATA